MKKFLLLFVAVCGVFASCGDDKDDDDNDNRFTGNEKAFIGTSWETTYFETEGQHHFKYVMTIKFFKDNKTNVIMHISEKIDGEYVPEGEGHSDDGTYSVKGNKLRLTIPDPDDREDETIEATINESEFVYIDDEDTFVFKLK